MKAYTKNYLKFFGYTTADFIACELCGAKAVDIHHIRARGMGGTKERFINQVENLMALCRECHDLLDGRAGTLTRHEKDVMFLDAAYDSIVWLLQEGHLKVCK